MEPRPLRIAYFVEFLLSLVAFFECWSQLGGQASLDLMPWWVKLLLAGVFSFTVVKFTEAAVRNDPFPALAVLRWGLGLALVMMLVAITTYYFHLNEPADDENADEPITTGLSISARVGAQA